MKDTTLAHNVLHGDCREVLRDFPPIADACITDPPYGDTSLGWDEQVPGWIPAVAKVLKPNASIWVFGSLRFLAPLFTEMDANGFRYSQDIVWEKQNGTGFHTDRFRRVHEHAVLFYRGAWADVYHDTQYTNDAVAKAVRRKQKPAHTRAIGCHNDASSYVSHDGGPRMQRSVIQINNEHGRAEHETQKPLGIVAPLIRYSVPPGGLVIDPFMGSGSTLLAAKIEGRRAIGIDNRDACCRIATRRLAEDAPLFSTEFA